MFQLLRNPLIARLRRPDRVRTRIAMVAMALRGLCGLGVPYFFGDTIGLIAAGAPREAVVAGSLRLVAIAMATAMCQFWMRWLFISASRRFECRLRDALFEHISTLSFGYFNRMRTGDVMSRLIADVEAVRMGIGPGVMHLFQTGIMAAGAVVIMMATFWQLTAVALVPMLLIFAVIRILTPQLHDSSLKVQEQLAALSSMAQESFSGARVVKAFAREDYEIGRFEREADTYIHDSMRMAMTRGRMHAIIEVMAGLVTVAVLYFGGRAVIAGTLEFGPFVSFFGYFMMMVWPMIALGWTLALFQRAKVAMMRLEAVFSVKPEITSGPVKPDALTGTWRLDGLTFTHDGASEPALSDVSLEIGEGRSLAVVGPTGSGKSTLVQILGRLLDPPAGTVFQDGVDVRELDLDSLRRSIAMVPQETFLFSDSIRANIAYADPERADDDTVERAAEAAQVLDAIREFPDGFEQVVGERGITLSGGQKQRVAIARALLHDAPTLVLDDSLSAVDTGTEERILHHLREVMHGRTTIIVAHRLSSVMHCDEIVVLKEGRVVERGDHDRLLKLGGWYAETYRRQLISRELEAA